MNRGVTSSFRVWSREEDEALRTVLPRQTLTEAMRVVPGRSYRAVTNRAAKLRLLRNRRWSSGDDALLTDLWETGIALRFIAKRLQRSVEAVYSRAEQLKLKLGCPPGFEYVRAAVERTGYDYAALRAILRWAKVRVRESMSRASKPDARYRRHFVDPLDVDEAIARWHETETLHAAAQRHDMRDVHMRRRLEAIGVNDFERRGRAHWRVLSADVDKAIKEE